MGTIHNSISIYSGVDRIKETNTIPLDIFFDYIQAGHWQDIVLPIRAIEDEKERDAAKKKLAPCVTIAGVFKQRADAELETHSGCIAIDIDDLEDPEQLKQTLSNDKYVMAAFRSISGRGLCVIFRVVPAKHREAFQGLREYLYNEYKIVTFDPTSINVSRARFISFDPYIYINDKAVPAFTHYPKDKPPKKIEKVIFAKDDFTNILKELTVRRLNVVESYYDWLRVCFSIVHHFGEAGRDYFHTISQYSSKYDSRAVDRQYSACLRHKGSDVITIATFYYYCKEAGIQVYSERTKLIAYSATYGKKGGLTAAQVADNLLKHEGIEDSEALVQEIMDSGVELNEDSILDQLEIFLRQGYSLRRNEITCYIEDSDVPMKKEEYNTIFIKAKKIFEKLSFELFERLIHSHFLPTYHPIKEFFEANREAYPKEVCQGSIAKWLSSIETKDNEFLQHFGHKWWVGAISSVYGKHSPLMFVLSGEKQNTGKTEFFRRMLPREIHHKYYAESKLDREKDDEILMCQKWFIMDDEMGGKSKKEVKKLKELTSKQRFSLREPYGRANVDLERLAVLCGTTNDNEILNDPTGNRRIIPIHVFSINFQQYNEVDEVALLMEAYWLYQEGFKWELDRADIDRLDEESSPFEMSKSESELVMKYFMPGNSMQMTASEIKVYIEQKTNQRLSLDAIGKELKRLGFEQNHVRVGKRVHRFYNVVRREEEQRIPPARTDDDVPF